jgi:ABC-type iron transport system FetAB ATPase subunit
MPAALLSIHALYNDRQPAAAAGGVAYGVDLDLFAGETVCLSGQSGAGKTLLLRAIADLDPNHGEVLLEGVPRDRFSGPAWRRRVTFCAAESAWWGTRVTDHFADAMREADGFALAAEVAGRAIAELSTGERQRLALWRALRVGPKVLLLDEPTAALDAAATRRIEATVRRYLAERGAAALWVSHDAGQIARIADRHLILGGGILTSAPASEAS